MTPSQSSRAEASRQQIEDPLGVCFSNVIGRLADAFGLNVPGSEALEAGAKYLLSCAYPMTTTAIRKFP